jgi:uncharacterized protein YgbK (DUF1537 family)
MTMTGLPSGPLLSWYGDDFTGAAAEMEAMSLAGLPAVLFFDTPTASQRAKFADYRGIGLAGIARSKNPAWMAANLPRVFQSLAEIGAPISQYKICSTLDSSPVLGSIGKAIEIALSYFEAQWIPLVVAAPPLGRYQLFGNLFAVADGVAFRLDRHPLSHHPVTPMHEADVRVHLAKQTDMKIGLVDYPALRSGRGAATLAAQLAAGARIVALDAIDDESLADAGELIWSRRGSRMLAIGSQGIAYALAAYFRRIGALPTPVGAFRRARIERIAVVSGSCSQVTARQIAWGETHGFAPIRVDPRTALDAAAWKTELGRVTEQAISSVGHGKDPLIFSARGPEDPAVNSLFEAVAAARADQAAVNETIGRGLGDVLNTLIQRANIRRAVIAGGDTSSYGAAALGIYALTLAAATVPGAALFQAHSADAFLDRLEIALKGGQMGAPDYFGQIKDGGITA